MMKASWLASRVACSRLTTPISGTRIVRTFGLRKRHSSLRKPNGNSLPLRSLVSSFRSGSVIMNATGTPSTSATMIRSSNTIGFSFLPA